MRIIAGELRGRRVEAPAGRETRPMLDRVREALFSTLAPWIPGEPPGARVLDLFAGSGSLGLEALSRGAAAVRFIESRPAALALLRRNVRALGVERRAQVVAADALAPASWGEEAHDVVLVDAPYPMVREGSRRDALLAALAALVRGLAPDGVLVLHAPRRALAESNLGREAIARERVYGTSSLWYVQAEGS